MKKINILVSLALTILFSTAFAQNNIIDKVELKTKSEQTQINKNSFSFESTTAKTQHTDRSVDEWIHIGTSSTPWGSYNFPIDMYFVTSMSQSIYKASEINHEPCLIEKLEYTYQTMADDQYPSVVEGENFRVWLCNTDRATLSQESGYWIPISEFTLVFEGEIKLFSGVNKKFTVNIEEPFVYSGSNLCVMVEHVAGEVEYMNHFNFEASFLPDNETRARSCTNWGIPFDFDLPTTEPSQTGMTLGNIADINIGISYANNGSLSGVVTNTTNNTLENVLVKISGTDLKTYSNSTGQYNFPLINPGNYNVNFTAFGYVDQSINIDINGATTQDVTMIEREKATLQGTVLDGDNNPIENVNISLKGYATYSATTDNNGLFNLPQVYFADNYTLTASKKGYINETIELDVNTTTVSIDNIYLPDKVESPSKITAIKNGNSSDISWLSPAERTIYRRDGGQLATQLGHNSSAELAVFGQVFRESAELYQMSWFTKYTDESHDFVNVFVFALDEFGTPTNNIIYKKNNVPNTDDQWTTFTFPYTIVAENGFMIAISYDGRCEIGIDAGLEADYPFEYGANWVSENYLDDPFWLLEDLGLGPIPGNFMIRAEGYNTNSGKQLFANKNAQNRALNSYSIYRLRSGDENMPGQWTPLATNLTDKNFSDTDISSLTPGWYRYAVRGAYSGGVQSDAGFSNIIETGLTTMVTMNVTTNTNYGESVGAIINLTSTNGLHSYTYTVENENGVVNLEPIFKANYYISITHEGFNNYFMSNVDFSTNNSYTIDCELIETLEKPFNLEIELKNTVVTFKWNHTENIFEDFESCSNFEIEPQGVVNWKYNDVDKLATIGIVSFQYPNENMPHSFMIFNPSETNPPIDLEANPTIAPFSGNKYLTSFGSVNGNNDDFIISPKLNFEKDFKFRFKAKSFSIEPKPNKIMVGYSETGYDPANFIWLTETPVQLAADKWYTYQYTIPASANYVTIHNVSDGGYILMIDDIEIFAKSTKLNSRHLVKYQVYLNDNQMGETTDYTFDFNATDLLTGQPNTAGVKAIYSSGESEMATTQFMFTDINENLGTSTISVYPNPSNGVFSIQLDDQYEVMITNIQGSVVFSEILTQGSQQLNLSNLSSGIYLINAKSTDKVFRQTIIIR